MNVHTHRQTQKEQYNNKLKGEENVSLTYIMHIHRVQPTQTNNKQRDQPKHRELETKDNQNRMLIKQAT